jgi:hypothetical protein
MPDAGKVVAVSATSPRFTLEVQQPVRVSQNLEGDIGARLLIDDVVHIAEGARAQLLDDGETAGAELAL